MSCTRQIRAILVVYPRLHLLDYPTRIAGSNAIGGNILYHHAASTNHRATPDGNSFQDDAAGTDEHMVFDDDGGTLAGVAIHRLPGREHFARIAHAPVQVVCIRIHDDAVTPDVHIVADNDTFLRPYARRRHAGMVTYLDDRSCPFRHDTSSLMAAKGIDVLARSKREVIPYLYMRLGMDVEVYTVGYLRPFAEVLSPDERAEHEAIVLKIPIAPQFARCL